jgi:nucleotide-binding universal stress UspA family protein
MTALHALVPLDGSPEADRAVDLVAGLKPSKVTLLHVEDGQPREDDYLDGVERRLQAAGVPEVPRLTQPGDAARVILEAAPKAGASLIALSMHGRSGWDLLRLGSVAERVIRSATLPVLVAPRQALPPGAGLLDRILAPQDGSELAEKALGRLGEIFPVPPQELHLLGVVEVYAGAARMGDEDPASRFYQFQADQLRGRLDAAAARTRPAARVHIDIGSPAAKILDHAQALKATLIAMSTHGRSGFTRWTLGSTTEKVLRASTLPLLVLR